jgi:CDP-diacylglycerol--glycerol-3-phosphate 3-phosphatidyltransferase
MSTATSLRNSIALHGALFFLAQGALLLGVTLGYGMPWGHFALFLGICAAYHGLLTGFLVARREDFHIEGTGVPLSRVNLSNTLTFGRLSSIPTIVFLIVQASYPILPVMLPLVCIVFATDWLDGIVARRRGEITFVGRYLDSSSDYLMIIAVSIMFYYFALIPLWFFILTICRLVLFAMGMALLALKEGKADPLSTFLGKASIFALMVLYVMEIARRFGVPWIGHEIVVQIMEYAVAIVVVISLVDKAIFLRRKFSKAAQRRAGTPPTAG